MYREPRLPQSPKEGILFMLTITFLSVNTIGALINMFEMGFALSNYILFLKIMLLMWLVVIAVVTFIAGPIVKRLFPLFIGENDGFNANILLNIVLNVSVLSIVFTIIMPIIGSGQMNMDTIYGFFPDWLRNFSLAFWIEILFAQPIARGVMKYIHRDQLVEQSKLLSELE